MSEIYWHGINLLNVLQCVIKDERINEWLRVDTLRDDNNLIDISGNLIGQYDFIRADQEGTVTVHSDYTNWHFYASNPSPFSTTDWHTAGLTVEDVMLEMQLVEAASPIETWESAVGMMNANRDTINGILDPIAPVNVIDAVGNSWPTTQTLYPNNIENMSDFIDWTLSWFPANFLASPATNVVTVDTDIRFALQALDEDNDPVELWFIFHLLN